MMNIEKAIINHNIKKLSICSEHIEAKSSFNIGQMVKLTN